MIILNFNVCEQRLQQKQTVFLANQSHNILQCQFSIHGEDWQDKQIFALLTDTNDDTYQLHLEDNSITVPNDVLTGLRFKLTLYADEDNTRITTNQVSISLYDSGYTEELADLEDVDPNIWTQIFNGIDSKSDNDHTHTTSDITDYPSLSDVAISGSYDDLSDKPELSEVATSGSYNDLSDTPSLSTVAGTGRYRDLLDVPDIPSKVSELTDDCNLLRACDITGLVRNDGSIDRNTYLTEHQSLTDYVRKSSTVGLIKNDGTIDTSIYLTQHQSLEGYVAKNNTDGLLRNDGTVDTRTFLTSHQDITGKQDKSNLVTEWNSTLTDTMYPSEKLVKEYVDGIIGDIHDYINR